MSPSFSDGIILIMRSWTVQSVAFVPSVVGLIIAGEVIKDLTVEERAIYFN